MAWAPGRAAHELQSMYQVTYVALHSQCAAARSRRANPHCAGLTALRYRSWLVLQGVAHPITCGPVLGTGTVAGVYDGPARRPQPLDLVLGLPAFDSETPDFSLVDCHANFVSRPQHLNLGR